MPTNNQAQVKMSAKLKASHVHTDGVAFAPGLGKESTSKQGSPLPRRDGHKFANFLPYDANGIPPSRRIGARARVAAILYAGAKRVFDLTLGLLLLLIAMPVVLIAAVAIRINTPGSPFFFQTRLGKNGKPFKIFKLRGMYIDARERYPTYYDYSKKRDLEFCFHHEEDPRVTRAGKLIRKTSIDELPNLWNVVLGQMSLVGPRPEIPEVLALYGVYRDEYLSVKPGITCLSKCTGRDRLTKRETIEFDLDYIRRRSFKADLSILWRTFRSVMLRRDVF
jgi:lipopolysaccharide/colanic/teichoic acid biosynthesis glycosyltransferase